MLRLSVHRDRLQHLKILRVLLRGGARCRPLRPARRRVRLLLCGLLRLALPCGAQCLLHGLIQLLRQLLRVFVSRSARRRAILIFVH